MDNKVIIIDERVVVLGSHNFIDNENTHNDENILIIDNHNIARDNKDAHDRVLATAKNPPPTRR